MKKLKNLVLGLLVLLSTYNIFSSQSVLDAVANTNDTSNVLYYLVISALALAIVIVLMVIKIKSRKKH